MGESFVSDGTMFPCLMVIDAVVYFGDVFICHSQMTESLRCCNHKKLNKEALLFIRLSSQRSSNMARYIKERCSQSCSLKQHKKYNILYFSKDQRTTFDLCVLAEAKSCTPCLSFILSLISSLPPPPLLLHLSISFLFVSLLSFPLPGVRPQEKIYRRWRDASGGQTRERLPVCLPYHSLWLI